jgi:hypothetical protein
VYDHGGGVHADFVGDVVDGQGVFVVAVADVAAVVAGVGAAVDEALRVVHVAVLAGASGAGWVGGVGHVDVDEPSSACTVPGRCADCDGVVEFGVNDDVVTAAPGQVGEASDDVVSSAEVDRVCRVEVEKFLHVEDLNAVVNGLAADKHVVAKGADFPPDRHNAVLG